MYEHSTNKKLSEIEVREIRVMHGIGGISHRKMEKLFNVSRSAIDGIINGFYHKHII